MTPRTTAGRWLCFSTTAVVLAVGLSAVPAVASALAVAPAPSILVVIRYRPAAHTFAATGLVTVTFLGATALTHVLVHRRTTLQRGSLHRGRTRTAAIVTLFHDDIFTLAVVFAFREASKGWNLLHDQGKGSSLAVFRASGGGVVGSSGQPPGGRRGGAGSRRTASTILRRFAGQRGIRRSRLSLLGLMMALLPLFSWGILHAASY